MYLAQAGDLRVSGWVVGSMPEMLEVRMGRPGDPQLWLGGNQSMGFVCLCVGRLGGWGTGRWKQVI